MRLAVLALVGALTTTMLGGCSSAPTKSFGSPEGKEYLFPYGEYRHQVHLQIQDKRFNFDGAVALKEDLIRVIALTPFGTTAFRLDENRKTGEIKTEFFVEAMKKHEAKVQDYYAVLRLLLVAKKSPETGWVWKKTDSQGRPLEAQVTLSGPAEGTTFLFKGYDDHGVPSALTIEHPKFKVDLEVSGYAL